MNGDSTDVGRPTDSELPDSLRHLFDGAADPTPLAAPDEESNGRAPAGETAAAADIDLTDEPAHEPAEKHARRRRGP